jgi:hypothetical protein
LDLPGDSIHQPVHHNCRHKHTHTHITRYTQRGVQSGPGRSATDPRPTNQPHTYTQRHQTTTTPAPALQPIPPYHSQATRHMYMDAGHPPIPPGCSVHTQSSSAASKPVYAAGVWCQSVLVRVRSPAVGAPDGSSLPYPCRSTVTSAFS